MARISPALHLPGVTQTAVDLLAPAANPDARKPGPNQLRPLPSSARDPGLRPAQHQASEAARLLEEQLTHSLRPLASPMVRFKALALEAAVAPR